MSAPSVGAKPLLRGHFHQAAFFSALGAGSMLVAKASNEHIRIPILVYVLSLTGLFGISALYHRIQWNPEMRVWLRRLDHSGIFLLIAGTATPLAQLALTPDRSRQLLVIIWAASALGIVQSLFWIHAPKWLTATLCVLTGWLLAPYFGEFRATLSPGSISLILFGGALYSSGALAYALKRPTPIPGVFGYHEIFHLLVVIAAGLHFIAIYPLVH